MMREIQNKLFYLTMNFKLLQIIIYHFFNLKLRIEITKGIMYISSLYTMMDKLLC